MPLVGRDGERAALDEHRRAAEAGHGRAVLVKGEPGIGKTTLLDDLAARADTPVLRTTAVEAERDLAFAALDDLLRPHRRPVHDDPYATYLAVIDLLVALAPVTVVVDDAQWLDGASREALRFVARRLDTTAVLLVVGARDEEPDWPGATTLPLGGLAPDDARVLLPGELADPVARRIVADTGGNPLALVEVPAELTAEQRRGAAPLTDPLPAGRSLEAVYGGRIARLPAATREALVLLALGGAADADALTAAEHAGLLTPDHRFGHPLIRSAAYTSADAATRRAAHRHLAEHGPPARRPWHLAAAATGPDEATATALEAAAREAEAQGALPVAADAYERAARLSDDPDRRCARLVHAGRTAILVGRHDLAATVLDEARPDPEAELLRGTVTLLQGQPLEARVFLEERATATGDDQHAAALLSVAGICLMAAGDMRELAVTAQRARDLAGPDADLVPSVLLAEAHAALGDPDAARALLAAHGATLAAEGALAVALHEVLVAAALALFVLDEPEEAERIVRRIVTAARESGAVRALPFALAVLATVEFGAGRWPLARTLLDEAIALARDVAPKFVLAYALCTRAYLEALAGDEEHTRAAAGEAAELERTYGLTGTRAYRETALGELELAAGRPDRAVEHFAVAEAHLRAFGIENPGMLPTEADLVEACLRDRRPEEAEHHLRAFAERAERIGSRWATMAVHRLHGLLATDDGFDAHFAKALTIGDELAQPFNRARVLLSWGERLRRAGRLLEARERLAAAVAEFERVGATPWAARARAELTAAGPSGRAPRAAPTPTEETLTAREKEICALVADGLSNREIAAALFLSPKTVEHHLRRAFRKLGVRSRTELAVRARR